MELDLAAEELALAKELRRVLNRLVLVAPDEGYAAYTDTLALIADRLEAKPIRPGSVLNVGDGLRPFDHLRLNPWYGTVNVIAAPMAMTFVDGPEGAWTEGSVTFGPAYEGPPGHVHGGCVAGMFDELLGRSQLGAGFTGTLTIRYSRPTPLLRPLELKAWIDRVDGRKKWVRGTCVLDGELLSEAEGLFIAPRGGASIEAITDAVNQR